MAQRGRPRKRRVEDSGQPGTEFNSVPRAIRIAWLMGMYQVWLWKLENAAVEPEADEPLSHRIPAAQRPLADSSTADQLQAQ